MMKRVPVWMFLNKKNNRGVVLAENAIEHVVRLLEILTLRCNGAELDEPVSKYQRRVQKGKEATYLSAL